MSRKQVLAPQLISSNHSLSASFISPPTVIDFLDNCSYQINVTTTNSIGSFEVQTSLDYLPGNPPYESQANGNWAKLDLSGSPSVGAANDTIVIDLNQLPFRAIRLAYTAATPGTGTASIYIMSKSVGA